MTNANFLKVDLEINLGGVTYRFPGSYVSTYGAGRLNTGVLDPWEHFGKKVIVSIFPKEKALEKCLVRIRATLTREVTTSGSFLGLKFDQDPQQFTELNKAISQYGIKQPTQYNRNYTRIPNLSELSTFPVRSLMLPHKKDSDLKDLSEFPMIFDVGNLNSTGALIYTESLLSLSVVPGREVYLVFQPSGRITDHIKVSATVCWTRDEINSSNGNLIRMFGVKFGLIEGRFKSLFADLLRDIISNLERLY